MVNQEIQAQIKARQREARTKQIYEKAELIVDTFCEFRTRQEYHSASGLAGDSSCNITEAQVRLNRLKFNYQQVVSSSKIDYKSIKIEEVHFFLTSKEVFCGDKDKDIEQVNVRGYIPGKWLENLEAAYQKALTEKNKREDSERKAIEDAEREEESGLVARFGL